MVLTLGVALFTKSSVIGRLETAEALISADNSALAALSELSLKGEQYRMAIDQVTAQLEQAQSEAEAQPSMNVIWRSPRSVYLIAHAQITEADHRSF